MNEKKALFKDRSIRTQNLVQKLVFYRYTLNKSVYESFRVDGVEKLAEQRKIVLPE